MNLHHSLFFVFGPLLFAALIFSFSSTANADTSRVYNCTSNPTPCIMNTVRQCNGASPEVEIQWFLPATPSVKLWRSVDNGNTWTEIWSGTGYNASPYNSIIDPNPPLDTPVIYRMADANIVVMTNAPDNYVTSSIEIVPATFCTGTVSANLQVRVAGSGSSYGSSATVSAGNAAQYNWSCSGFPAGQLTKSISYPADSDGSFINSSLSGTSGTPTTGPLNQTGTATLNCTQTSNNSIQASAQVLVNISQTPTPLQQCSVAAFTVNGLNSVTVGPSIPVSLFWDFDDDADGILTTGGQWAGSGNKLQAGNQTVIAPSAPGTYNYTLTCIGTNNIPTVGTVTVNVSTTPPPTVDADVTVEARNTVTGSLINANWTLNYRGVNYSDSGTSVTRTLSTSPAPPYLATVTPGSVAGYIHDHTTNNKSGGPTTSVTTNDNITFTVWYDPSGPLPECSDGVDNADPEDTIADFPFDPGCTDPSDNDETDPPLPPPPSCTVDLKVNNSDGPITVGTSQNLTMLWTSSGAVGPLDLRRSGSWSGNNQLPNGTTNLSSGSSGTKTYTLTCRGTDGIDHSDSVVVNVTGTPPPVCDIALSVSNSTPAPGSTITVTPSSSSYNSVWSESSPIISGWTPGWKAVGTPVTLTMPGTAGPVVLKASDRGTTPNCTTSETINVGGAISDVIVNVESRDVSGPTPTPLPSQWRVRYGGSPICGNASPPPSWSSIPCLTPVASSSFNFVGVGGGTSLVITAPEAPPGAVPAGYVGPVVSHSVDGGPIQPGSQLMNVLPGQEVTFYIDYNTSWFKVHSVNDISLDTSLLPGTLTTSTTTEIWVEPFGNFNKDVEIFMQSPAPSGLNGLSPSPTWTRNWAPDKIITPAEYGLGNGLIFSLDTQSAIPDGTYQMRARGSATGEPDYDTYYNLHAASQNSFALSATDISIGAIPGTTTDSIVTVVPSGSFSEDVVLDVINKPTVLAHADFNFSKVALSEDVSKHNKVASAQYNYAPQTLVSPYAGGSTFNMNISHSPVPVPNNTYTITLQGTSQPSGITATRNITLTVAAPECSDGVDNSDPEDTLADASDPGCINGGVYDPTHTDETDLGGSPGPGPGAGSFQLNQPGNITLLSIPGTSSSNNLQVIAGSGFTSDVDLSLISTTLPAGSYTANFTDVTLSQSEYTSPGSDFSIIANGAVPIPDATYSITIHGEEAGGGVSDNKSFNIIVNTAPECSDGFDNDGDGKIDRDDPRCIGPGGVYNPLDDNESPRDIEFDEV